MEATQAVISFENQLITTIGTFIGLIGAALTAIGFVLAAYALKQTEPTNKTPADTIRQQGLRRVFTANFSTLFGPILTSIIVIAFAMSGNLLDDGKSLFVINYPWLSVSIYGIFIFTNAIMLFEFIYVSQKTGLKFKVEVSVSIVLILLSLGCTCFSFFQNGIQIWLVVVINIFQLIYGLFQTWSILQKNKSHLTASS